MSKKDARPKNKFKGITVPDTYAIIFFVVLFAALLTYIIPQGQYSTYEASYTIDGTEKTKTVIESGSFRYITDQEGEPLKKGIKLFEPFGEVGLFNYLFEGLVSGDKWGSAVGIIAFILVIGGAFGIILETGAVEIGILNLIRKSNGREKLLIPVLFILFSLGGAVFGMGEEALPFAMILIPMVIAMGYDSVVGILITYVATQIGFGTSWMNPFSVAIAQGIAGVPVFSGTAFRIVIWILFTGAGTLMTMYYASKIKENPSLSVAFESDIYHKKDLSKHGHTIENKFTVGHALVIFIIIAVMVWVIWGVMSSGYYIPEIATQFFIMGLACGTVGIIFKLNGMTLNKMAAAFKKGSSDLAASAIIVGMAQGIMLILGGSDPTSGTVLNTILNSVSNLFMGISGTLAAVVMFIFQSIFNFFVVSGSGQAALTMPIMAPLSDLLNVTRQTSVLAFQLGDALTNLIVPTSGCLMGALAIARLDWSKWVKFMYKFLGVLFIMGILTMITASLTGF